MILVIQYKVHDFDSWKPVFDEQEGVRRGHGCTGCAILRDSDEPSDLTVVLQFPTRKAAERFLAEPAMAAANRRGGVETPLRLTWVGEAEAVGLSAPDAA